MKTKSDSNLLFLLVAIVIAFLCWFFGFNKMNAKSAELDTKIASLDSVINQRNEYKKNSEQYESDTKKFNESKDVFLGQFQSKLLPEDVFALVRDMIALDNGDNPDIRIGVESGTIGNPTEVYSTEGSSLKGYMQEISIEYNASYDGLKTMLNYINGYDKRCNITGFDASGVTLDIVDTQNVQDSNLFRLSGNIRFNMFYVNGDGEDRYEAPIPSGDYSFGTKNPFILSGNVTNNTDNKANNNK